MSLLWEVVSSGFELHDWQYILWMKTTRVWQLIWPFRLTVKPSSQIPLSILLRYWCFIRRFFSRIAQLSSFLDEMCFPPNLIFISLCGWVIFLVSCRTTFWLFLYKYSILVAVKRTFSLNQLFLQRQNLNIFEEWWIQWTLPNWAKIIFTCLEWTWGCFDAS